MKISLLTTSFPDNFHLHRDLPIAIGLATMTLTVIYTLTNAAYLAVLTPAEMIASDAVAVVRGRGPGFPVDYPV